MDPQSSSELPEDPPEAGRQWGGNLHELGLWPLPS